jgi:hypothetical protein
MSRDLDVPLAHRYEQYVSGTLPSERHQRFEFDIGSDGIDDAAIPVAGLDTASASRSYQWAGPT